MSDSKYPLIEKLGAEILIGHRTFPYSSGYHEYVRAEDLERILENALRVKGVSHEVSGGYSWAWTFDEARATHEAILLRPQPLRKDTAEDLLREFVNEYPREDFPNFYDRAKKLLDNSGE